MKNSFKIFAVIAGLIVILIILRLNSISYPRDIENNAELIYLEELHDYANIFTVRFKENRFLLTPHTSHLKIKGVFVEKTVELKDDDLITLENHEFLFNAFPRKTFYKEVFHRPIIEVFPGFTEAKYIGGWLTKDREQILAQANNRDLLKNLLVEISAAELKQLIPVGKSFDGKLLELHRIKNNPSGALRGKSLHLPITRIRGRQWDQINENSEFEIQDGDILALPYQDSNQNTKNTDGTDITNKTEATNSTALGEKLFIKFNIARIQGLTYLSIAYKEKVPTFSPGEQVDANKPGKEIAFLKSIDSGVTYNINKEKENTFIGGKELFSFNLKPQQLMAKLYIPDKIPEGGMVDIKELLDRDMYYHKDNCFYPVTRDFLSKVKEQFGDKNKKQSNDMRNYFETNNIAWRDFIDTNEFENYTKTAAALIHRMENKGIFQVFSREVEKLNNRHQVMGVGLSVDKSLIREIVYKSPGHSWLNASPLRENTPIISGIDTFYWGSLIGLTDEPVEFRITFTQNPPPVRLIATADFGYSFDGQLYTGNNFFDGPQVVKIPIGQDKIFIKVWNLETFNRRIGSTNFQAEIVFTNPGGNPIRLISDETWESSINTAQWASVLVNPPYGQPDPGAGSIDSLWYDETWDPVYSGLKFRFFRKKFQLEAIPSTVTWKIFASGDYSLRVNRRIVQTANDFVKALNKGTNEITIMVARKGYRKNFYTDYMLKADNNRLLLKQDQVERTSFSKIAVTRKPLIADLNNTPLAYNAEVNAKWQRFYASEVPAELLSFFGSSDEGVWGLEQIFSKLTPEDRVASAQLTINREWQTIVLDAMKKTLQANKESELNDLDYQNLKKALAAAEIRLQAKRSELALSETTARQSIMQDIIGLQTEIEDIKNEINKVKNYFYEAAVVLMGLKGDILTAASYPYNDETMKELNPDIARPYLPRENPYLNRSWAWKYNPGSTAKILDSVAFLCSADRKDDRGRYLFPYLRELLNNARSFKDFPRLDLQDSFMLNGKEIVFQIRNFQGHVMPEGFCSLTDAFAHSYNTYFSYLALHNNRVLTLDSLAYGYENNQTDEDDRKTFINKAGLPVAQTYIEYPTLAFAERLMINREIDLLYNLRDAEFAAKFVRAPSDSFMAIESQFPVNAYRAANVAHYSIGQGDFQVTALQNAMIAAAVLNRGILYHPFIVQSVVLKEGEEKIVSFDPERDKAQVFPEAVADQIKEAMKAVVDRGTANTVFSEIREGRQFYAKTGTAETELYRDNSLFVGFVTFKDGTPLVFSVIVPRAGLGAKIAGKLTEDILKAVIEYENNKGRNW